MALKKSELYSSFWASCDELRGGMDASQYKDYVLEYLMRHFATESGKGKGQFYTPAEVSRAMARLLHILRSMKSTAKGACILPHGVLFRGGAEAAIRRNLVQRGHIEGIIGLPATSSMAPASRPASSSSTRKAPPPARASS